MPMTDKNNQTPATKNQIENVKPNVEKTETLLTGFIANSMNGGHNRTIAYKRVMAGEKHKEYKVKLHIKMLTPFSPAFQRLQMTIDSYFVPDSRVWTNAEKFYAQNGGTETEKIEEMPNLGGYKIPLLSNEQDETYYTLLSNSMQWRDSWISSYIPRMGVFGYSTSNPSFNLLPKVNALPLRGRIAIYNDFERNKEYDEELEEYKTDTVTQNEFNSYMPNHGSTDINEMRARRNNSYYTDYRTNAQGRESRIPSDSTDVEGFENFVIADNNTLVTWASWESKIAEYRSQAENAQLNPWDVIAKIRGSKKLTEGKVQHIGRKTFDLNYSTITQSTYNNNENVTEEYTIMGTQGAYSYTEVNLPIYAGMIFNEEGTVHIIARVTAETVFESAFDRTMLNVGAMQQYRPDLKDDKLDLLYNIETTTEWTSENDSTMQDWINHAIGFKRKYNELFKLPNCIAGDMTSNNYYQTANFEGELYNNEIYLEEIETQKTFQFFENGSQYYVKSPNVVYYKDYWKDYTDLMINKNLAIMEEVVFNMEETAQTGKKQGLKVMGQNQIFLVGKAYCLAELPVDESIKHNYTEWGEH